MRRSQIRTTVAVIVLAGHFLVFLVGLLLGVFGPLGGADAVQTLLMASPILGVTATSALRFALRDEPQVADTKKVSGLFAFVTIFFPFSLIACIAVVFAAVYKEVSGFGPDQMKIALGGIETFFGVFLGAISDTLFGGASAEQIVRSGSATASKPSP